MPRDIDLVWSWTSAIAAAVSGLLYGGYVWWMHIRRPAFNGKALAALAFVDVLMGAFLFTVGQTAAALWNEDPGWVRVMSRYGMWVPFAAAFALTLAIVIRWRHRPS